MNQIWQKFLAKQLKINKKLLTLVLVFIKKVKNYKTEIYQQSFGRSFGVAPKHCFGTMIKERDSFLKNFVPRLFSV